MDTIGALEAIGAADVNELMHELGIAGDGVPQRRIVGNSDVGRPRAWPFGFARSASTADAASVSMSMNADRDCFLKKLTIVATGETLAAQAASSLTACTIGGRNATIGAGGYTPLSCFSHDSLSFHSFGVVKSGNPVVITVTNNSGGALVYAASFVAQTID